MKTTTCLLRLSETENNLLTYKSKLLGTSKSKLFREAALKYWSDDFDAGGLLELYKSSDKENKQLLVETIAAYYRQNGYPHHKLTNYELNSGMKTLVRTKSPLLENDHLQTNTVGLALANYFHPHMVKVPCLEKYRTPYEQFEDDDLLKDAIRRWMELNKKPDPSGLRRILRTRDKVRSVVNFKPAISLFLYNAYAHKDSWCLDPCMGFGGRLCGVIAANKNLLYHGIDVDAETCVGNARLAGFYHDLYDVGIEKKRTWQFRFKMDMGCAEDIMLTLPDETYGLIFTSPPFFQIEKYSKNPAQSYLRYPEYEIWRNKFLFTLIKESFRLCKKGGYLILNLKDYKKHPIATDAVKFAESVGFRLIRTYSQRLGELEDHWVKGEKEEMFHTEAIFVWEKE